MNEKYALGVDIGGSHIACQVVELGSSRPVGETYTEVKIAENESAQKILAAWDSALGACMQKAGARAITGLGVAMPSPFDFIKGIAMAEHKFASIKGMNVRAELHRLTGIDPSRILFTNDAAGFGMGAWSLGGGNARHLIGVTLGTGFGACFIVDGCYATYGPGVPIGGELWDYRFRGPGSPRISSRRAGSKRSSARSPAWPSPGVKPMIDYYHADKYTAEVRAIFDEFAARSPRSCCRSCSASAPTRWWWAAAWCAPRSFSSRSCAPLSNKRACRSRWWRWPTRPPRSSPGRPRCVNNRTGQVSGYRPDNLRGVWLWFRLPHLTLGSQSLIPVLEYSS